MKANQNPKDLKKNKAGVQNVIGSIIAIILLIVGFAVASLLTIFTSVLGGQTYQLTQSQIASITNGTISNYINASIGSAFQAQSQVSGYLPIIALAVIITIVISLVVGGIAGQFMGAGGGYGGYNRYDGVL